MTVETWSRDELAAVFRLCTTEFNGVIEGSISAPKRVDVVMRMQFVGSRDESLEPTESWSDKRSKTP